MNDKERDGDALEGALTRRTLIKRAGIAGGMLAAGPLVAACGGSGGGSSSGGSTSGGASTSAATKSAASGSLPMSPEAKELRDLLEISTADAQKLVGQSIKFGAILPLSGPGAQYATEEQNGVKLGLAHLTSLFGMKVQYSAQDHKSGDPQAAAQASRTLGIAGFGTAINSYLGGFGADVPGVGQYKMMSFDPGGGSAPPLFGKPYFWGWRAVTPNDALAGAYMYVTKKLPQAKRVTMLAWDLGATFNNPIKAALVSALKPGGQQLVGVQLQKVGTQDYSTFISTIKGQNPDIIQLVSYALDPAYFMKEFVNSGIKAQVIGPEFTPAAAKVAGAAYNPYWAASDSFPFNAPPNPYSKFFLKEYQKMFGQPANSFYEPNYYECTMGYLQLYARVASKGGSINDGSALQDACKAKPMFKSVYGGNSSTVGEIVLDTVKQTPVSREMGLFSFSASGAKQHTLASYDIGGKDFKVVS